MTAECVKVSRKTDFAQEQSFEMNVDLAVMLVK
jgi:hypothetical protein